MAEADKAVLIVHLDRATKDALARLALANDRSMAATVRTLVRQAAAAELADGRQGVSIDADKRT